MKSPKERFVTWSYCRDVKEEYKTAIAFFKRWLPTHVCRSDISEEERMDIYSNSIFVFVFDKESVDEIERAGAIPIFVEKNMEERVIRKCLSTLEGLR